MKRLISCRAQCIRIAVLSALIACFHVVGSATTVVSTIPVTAGPVRIAMSPTRNRAYVSCRDSDTVWAIDTTTHTVVGGVFVQPSQSAPHGITVSPDGSQIWVANRASGTVNIIDADTLQLRVLMNVGGQPDQIVFSHDGGRAFIPNTTFGLGVYSTVTDTPFGFIPVTGVHKSLVVSDDDRVGYLGVVEPDGSNARTLLLDLTNVAGLSTISVLGQIQDTWLTLFNQNASTGWGRNSINNTISLVHLGRLEIRTNIAVLPNLETVKLSPNGKRLYVVSDLSNEIRIFAASNGQLLETVSVGGRPTDIVFLPDGVTAYVTQSDTSSIAVLSL